MKAEFSKIFWDGQKSTDLGTFKSLEIAHLEHSHYKHQQTFEDIDSMSRSIPYIHIIEFRDGEHYNDFYFTWREI